MISGILLPMASTERIPPDGEANEPGGGAGWRECWQCWCWVASGGGEATMAKRRTPVGWALVAIYATVAVATAQVKPWVAPLPRTVVGAQRALVGLPKFGSPLCGGRVMSFGSSPTTRRG